MGRLEVQCLAVNIPEVIVVSVKDLDVGQTIHASEVQLPEGVTLASPADLIVAACRVVAEIKTTEQVEAETPVAPEVIGAEKEPEEAAEEEEK
jgi:large subunit ribosomal protein L25